MSKRCYLIIKHTNQYSYKEYEHKHFSQLDSLLDNLKKTSIDLQTVLYGGDREEYEYALSLTSKLQRECQKDEKVSFVPIYYSN